MSPLSKLKISNHGHTYVCPYCVRPTLFLTHSRRESLLREWMSGIWKWEDEWTGGCMHPCTAGVDLYREVTTFKIKNYLLELSLQKGNLWEVKGQGWRPYNLAIWQSRIRIFKEEQKAAQKPNEANPFQEASPLSPSRNNGLSLVLQQRARLAVGSSWGTRCR